MALLSAGESFAMRESFSLQDSSKAFSCTGRDLTAMRKMPNFENKPLQII